MLQGGNNGASWVTSFKVSYSLNGLDWTFVDDEKIFGGNYDATTKVPINFDDPVYARVIRIHPQTWNKAHICLRFDAILADIHCLN